jgi:hypothetical protein
LATRNSPLSTSQDQGNETLTNTAFKSYQYGAENARQFRVEPRTETLFLVETPRGHGRIVTLPEDNNWKMVNFWDGKCSCRLYQEYAAPCSHALAAIKSIGKEPFNYFPWWSRRRTQINYTIKFLSLQSRLQTSKPIPISNHLAELSNRGGPVFNVSGMVPNRRRKSIVVEHAINTATIRIPAQTSQLRSMEGDNEDETDWSLMTAMNSQSIV